MNPTTTGEANATTAALVREIAASHRAQRGALLPILHAVQEALGCVPPEAIPVLADELNLSRADVHGVVSFYHDFRSEPAGRATVRVCRAEACQAVGAERLVSSPAGAVRLSLGETSPGRFADRRAGLLPGQLRAGPCGAGGRPAPRPAGRGSPVVDNRRGGLAMSTSTRRRHGLRAARLRGTSVGADEVADALERAAARRAVARFELVRNGSRGMLWLEPLVEVATPDGPGRLRPGHRRATSTASSPPACSTAPTTRCGSAWSRTCPGWRRRTGSPSPGSASSTRCRPTTTSATAASPGCARALAMSPADVVAEVTDSGLRGRGGAGFPAGIKWKTVARLRRRAEVRLLQRRRGRQRHVRRPDADGGRPVHAHRGHDDRRPRRRRHARATSTSARSTPTRSPRCAPPSTSPASTGWLGDDVLGSALELRPARAGRRRRLHLRRGDLDAGEPRGQARRGPRQAADPGDRGAVRQADRGQQRAHPGHRARRSSPTARRRTPSSASDRSRGTQVFQLAGNIARGGIVETAFGITLGELVDGLRRRHALRPAGAGGPGRRPARRLPADVAVRPADGLRGVRRGRRDGRPRRHRGLRRHRRHGGAGPVRDGVLRRGVVRQVHAVPGRLGARRRGDRPDHRRRATATRTWCCSTTCAR